jgi:transcriptional regulator with XRE-family HTH domain
MPRRKQAPSGFGERLLALRTARGLTQTELAEAIDSSQRAISYYENHATHPAADVVIALSHALGVTTDELLGVKAPKRATARAVAEEAESRRLWKRFQVVEELPEKDQRAVFRLIQSLGAVRSSQRATVG